ncbi:hypothetical protein H2248_012330 [Termitomyces sp. 'cryptogamus']|nr:hypothetical protein H2248_012330 [Termitomyces sp. 'cryptogamus']
MRRVGLPVLSHPRINDLSNSIESQRVTFISLPLVSLLMKIAVEGCCHGELDAIYSHIAQLERKNGYKVDLLLICGDFQAMRNFSDLYTMSCPSKYREIKDFHRYYSGAKKAPIPTIVIGGNHEASNYLWELYHGGWLAPNIYFLGHAGSVIVDGLRISGASGIYKENHYQIGYDEQLPYDSQALRSIYHVREYCVRKLSLLPQPDIFISHDWPNTIEQHGDVQALMKKKRYLQSDIEARNLGSPPFMDLLKTLKPQRWFAAHMHARFEAEVMHNPVVKIANSNEITIEDDLFDEESPKEISTTATKLKHKIGTTVPNAPLTTKFLALDKCLPRRQFLEVLDISCPAFDTAKQSLRRPKPNISFDPHWLAITRAFHPMLSLGRKQAPLPDEAEARASVERELQWVNEHVPKKLGGKWAVEKCQKFVKTAMSVSPRETGRMKSRTRGPSTYTNPQTVALCDLLEMPNKINPSFEGKPDVPPPPS